MSIRSFNTFHPQLGEHCYVDESAVVIGQIFLGNNCSVWPTAVLRGDVNPIAIGNQTNIQDGSILHTNQVGAIDPNGSTIQIGNGVTIGHRVTLHGCRIEDYCLIGMNCCILDHSVIESEVLLGAGSLVPPGKRLTSGYLYLGSPAKQIRPLTQTEKDNIRYSAEHYSKLKDQYR